jgi:hypothetical protein
VADIKRPRRFYLHKRIEAEQRGEDGQVWQAKQEAQPGAALATTLPHRAALVACGYTTTEDLDGADEAELVRAGLTRPQALAIIAAL